MGDEVFSEEQRFVSSSWLRVGLSLVLVAALVLAAGWKASPSPVPVTAAVALVMVLTGFMLVFARFTTVLTRHGLDLRLHGFSWVWPGKRLPLASIRSWEAAVFPWYVGYGVRYGLRGGLAVRLQGRRCVRLELEGGGRILLGTQHPEGLMAELAALKAERPETSAPPGGADRAME